MSYDIGVANLSRTWCSTWLWSDPPVLKCRISSWDPQYLSLQVMLKSKRLNLFFGVDFMTLTISKLDYLFIYLLFLEFIVYLRASSQNFVETHQLLLFPFWYFIHMLENQLFNITYLHTTCTISKICRLFFGIFFIIDCLNL